MNKLIPITIAIVIATIGICAIIGRSNARQDDELHAAYWAWYKQTGNIHSLTFKEWLGQEKMKEGKKK